jgi:hypothetical protein
LQWMACGPSRKEVIFVAAIRERPMTEVTRMPTRSHATEWVVGTLGVLAAAVGAWMYYVPTDWFLGGLVEGWYFSMFIAAGVLLTAAFGLFARITYRDRPEWTMPVTLSTILAIAAFGGAITFALLWIL